MNLETAAAKKKSPQISKLPKIPFERARRRPPPLSLSLSLKNNKVAKFLSLSLFLSHGRKMLVRAPASPEKHFVHNCDKNGKIKKSKNFPSPSLLKNYFNKKLKKKLYNPN